MIHIYLYSLFQQFLVFNMKVHHIFLYMYAFLTILYFYAL